MLHPPDKTLVLGHRGASAYAPQNTLPAFQLALEQGADGVELDVHLSRDGHAVVIHDFTVDHTTNGTGLVADMTLEQLKALDAGGWMNAKFAGVQVPTLDEVFAVMGDTAIVNVEIKADTVEIEQVVAAVITRHQMTERVVVSSFNPAVLKRFRQVMPEVAIGLLYVPMEGYDPREVLREMPHQAVHPYHEMIDESYMEWAKGAGYVVNTWTVNDGEKAVTLRDLGVNAIITDQPDTIIAALKTHQDKS
jgi:glycerophosphoryl diester phosphodiesterase